MTQLSINRIRQALLAATLLGCCSAGAFQKPSTKIQTDTADLYALQKRALEEAEAGQTVAAIHDIQLVLDLRPDWQEGWWNLGVLEYTDSQYTAAITPLQHVVAFAPQNATALALLGLCEFETRDYAHSLDNLQRAKALGLHDDAETERVSAYHLGLLLVWHSDFDAASKLLLSSFGRTAPSPELKLALGLATLRVPLLPDQLDPSQEPVLLSAGEAAASPSSPSALATLAGQHPDVPNLAYAAGIAFEQADRDADAFVWLEREIARFPTSPLPWSALAELERRSPALAKQQHAPPAEQRLAALGPQAVAEDRQRIVARYALPVAAAANADPHAFLDRGMQEYAAGQFTPAATDLKQWLNANPGDGTAWAVLGLCAYALGQYDGALLDLSRGASLGLKGAPTQLALARYTFGVLLVRNGQFDHAAEVLNAIGPGPLDHQVEFAQGLALLHRPKLPTDIPAAKQELMNNAGSIARLLEQSHYDAAFTALQALIRQYPSESFLHYAYGNALIAVSEFDQAAIQMHAELELTPASELPAIGLASIALRQHDAASAASWSRQALAIAPNSAQAHYLLGRSALDTGDASSAVRELEAASQISPASPEIHFNLAKAYARAKMPEKAEHERAIFSSLQDANNAPHP